MAVVIALAILAPQAHVLEPTSRATIPANVARYDGRVTTGELAGRTVNVKARTRYERMLDIN